jgi:uncharacterized protein
VNLRVGENLILYFFLALHADTNSDVFILAIIRFKYLEFIYLVFLSLSGFAIGFAGGMIGLVLGVVRFPVILGAETSVTITTGTNLGVSTLGAITAAIRHYRQKNVQLRPFIFLASTGAVGAFIGSLLTGYVPFTLLLVVIGLVVSYEAYALLKSSKSNNKTSDNIPNYSKNKLILLESSIGFGVGVLGGLVGLVLGSIRMPAMISILKMEPKVAVGTNLAASSIMGIFGLLGHIISNNIDYIVILVMGPAAMLGGYLGARYTNRFSEKTLKHIIAIVLIVVAITMFLRALYLY